MLTVGFASRCFAAAAVDVTAISPAFVGHRWREPPFTLSTNRTRRPSLHPPPPPAPHQHPCCTTMIFKRVASWLANEIVTKQLANSESFQKAALTLHRTMESNTVVQNMKTIKRQYVDQPQMRQQINPYLISSVPPKRNASSSSSANRTASEAADSASSTVNQFIQSFKQNLTKEMEKLGNNK